MEEQTKQDRVITVWVSLFVRNHAETCVQACTSRTNLAIIAHNALPGPLVLLLRVVSKQDQTAE